MRFVTRGYIAPAPTPTLFTHWGYLAPSGGVEPPIEIEMRPVVTPSVQANPLLALRAAVRRDDEELLLFIQAYFNTLRRL